MNRMRKGKKSLYLLLFLFMIINIGFSVNPKTDIKVNRISREIGKIYSETILKVTSMLQSKPAVPIVIVQLKQLKEESVLKLIKLGKERSKLNISDKRKIDQNVNSIVKAISPDLKKKFDSLVFIYESVDKRVGKLLKSFDQITIYSNFELLKRKKPEEIKRIF